MKWSYGGIRDVVKLGSFLRVYRLLMRLLNGWSPKTVIPFTLLAARSLHPVVASFNSYRSRASSMVFSSLPVNNKHTNAGFILPQCGFSFNSLLSP
jgi:hypothetical protein